MIYQYEIIKNNKSNKMELKILKKIKSNQEEFDNDDCVNLLNEYYYLDECDSENVFLIAFGYERDIVGIYRLAIGDYNTCDVYNRKIVIFLALTGATEFAIYHNHPGGTLEPSVEDISCEKQLEILGDLIKIDFLGSFIITTKGWNKI